jgi:hypothetical protein
VCENLNTEMKKENEKFAASLTNQFRAENENLRQELPLEIQTSLKPNERNRITRKRY